MLDLIKGRRVGEALETVAFTKKGVAPLVEKVLRSAIQNANYLSQEQDLDRGCRQPLRQDGDGQRRTAHEAHPSAPMGRAFRYQRRLAHIVISVAERKRGWPGGNGWSSEAAAAKKRMLKGAAKKAAAKKAGPRRAQQKLEEGREVG